MSDNGSRKSWRVIVLPVLYKVVSPFLIASATTLQLDCGGSSLILAACELSILEIAR